MPTVAPVPQTSPASGAPPAPATSPPFPTVTSVDSYAPPGFVDLSDVDPTIQQDIRYYTDHNFVGRRIDGYLEPRCLLIEPAARALQQAQTAAVAKGYSLKVYDCYRPARAGEDFAAWARALDDQTTKGEFYPDEGKNRLFADGYVGGGQTTHSSGTAVDLTLVTLPTAAQRQYQPGEPLVPCTAPVDQRFPDNTIDMGTGYDCFDARSHTLDSRITGVPLENRLLLRQFMTGAGFANYANEWWHYDFTRDRNPGMFYDFPVARAALQ